MTRVALSRSLGLSVALALGCRGDDAPTGSGTDESGGVPTTTAPAMDTGSTGPAPIPEVVLEQTLVLEALESASLTVTRTGDELSAALTLSRGYGVAPADTELTGVARIDAYPEAGATVYTARLTGPPIADGRCGEQAVSLALSLHKSADAEFIAGGLTPYCGDDTWFGIPVIEPLRLSSP